MKKLLMYLLLLLPLAMASCGGDDEPSPTNDSSQNENPEYQVRQLKMTDEHGIGLACDLYCTVGYRDGNHSEDNLVLSFRNSFYGGYTNSKFASANISKVGIVAKLSDIKSKPTSGWVNWQNSHPNIKLNDGFVVEIYDGSQFYYFRLMISQYIRSANNQLVDVVVLVQRFNPTN